jgi:predicted nucleic acid-binding protein
MRAFIDSNVLLYTVDRSDSHRRRTAQRYLLDISRRGRGVISTQVMQEFSHNAMRKMGLSGFQVKATLREMSWMDVVTIQPAMIDQAIDLSITDQLSFWDALILTAAATARCEVVASEDLNPGQLIRGVRVVNPFA